MSGLTIAVIVLSGVCALLGGVLLVKIKASVLSHRKHAFDCATECATYGLDELHTFFEDAATSDLKGLVGVFERAVGRLRKGIRPMLESAAKKMAKTPEGNKILTNALAEAAKDAKQAVANVASVTVAA